MNSQHSYKHFKFKIAFSATCSSKGSYHNPFHNFFLRCSDIYSNSKWDSADRSVCTCLYSKVWNTVWTPLLISVLIRGIIQQKYLNHPLHHHCLHFKVKCSTNIFLTIDKIRACHSVTITSPDKTQYSICIHDILSYKLH